MGRWLIPGIGALVLAGAVAVGAVVWTQQGDGTTARLRWYTRSEGLRRAGSRTKEILGDRASGRVRRRGPGAGCGRDDARFMMPGGMMMRASKHPGS
jgi:hypothetical protein